MESFSNLKNAIAFYTGLEKDALHIHVALLLYVLALWIFRQTRRSRFPWIAVFLIEMANEGHDLIINWPEGPHWAISESAKDLWNTMLWPTVLLLVGRYTDWFSRTHPVERADDETA